MVKVGIIPTICPHCNKMTKITQKQIFEVKKKGKAFVQCDHCRLGSTLEEDDGIYYLHK